MTVVFEWAERGSALVARTYPGGGLVLHARDDHGETAVELPVAAVHELREALVEQFGDPQRAELLEAVHATEQDLGDLEHERDELLERVKTLDQQLREALAAVEHLKTAGEIADRRTHALEQLVEQWNVDGDTRRAEYRIAKSTAARAVSEVISS